MMVIEHTLFSPLNKSVPIENTKKKLIEAMREGYHKGKWVNDRKPCKICRRLNSKNVNLNRLVKNAKYNAPMYTKTHPNCRCRIHVGGNVIRVKE